MKIKAAVVVLVLFFAATVYGQDVSHKHYVGSKNSDKYLVFVQPGEEIAEVYKILGYEKWVISIRKAADMLPEAFLEKFGKQKWHFRINNDDWTTGNPGLINLLPSREKPEWMTWEPFVENGFEESEMVFVALHEMGHMFSRGHELNFLDINHYKVNGKASWVWYSKRKELVLEVPSYFDMILSGVLERPVTLYGKVMGRDEDFADTFALYVLWPEYLKENFPMHYVVVKNILGREYKSTYPMPSSVTLRLIVRDHAQQNR